MKRGKKYVEAAKAVDRATLYDTAEAISLVKKSAVATDLTPSLQDALLALVALGYTQKEVDRITPKLAKLPENTADGYIKEALALLLKK